MKSNKVEVTLCGNGLGSHIFVDGEVLPNVQSIQIEQCIGEVPKVHIDVALTQKCIANVDNAEIEFRVGTIALPDKFALEVYRKLEAQLKKRLYIA